MAFCNSSSGEVAWIHAHQTLAELISLCLDPDISLRIGPTYFFLLSLDTKAHMEVASDGTLLSSSMNLRITPQEVVR